MSKIDILVEELKLSDYSELVSKQDYEGLRDKLNLQLLIDNPIPQQQVPVLPTSNDGNTLYALLTPQEKNAIAKLPNMSERLMAAFANGNIQLITQAYQAMQIELSSETQSTIETFLTNLASATQPDPSYQSKIRGVSRAEELAIYPVTEHEIQSALNPLGVLDAAE